MTDVEVARGAVAKLRGMGLTDDQVEHRLNQAVSLASAQASDYLVNVVAKIAATGRITQSDIQLIGVAINHDTQRALQENRMRNERPPVGSRVLLTKHCRYMWDYHQATIGSVGGVVRHSRLTADDEGVLVDFEKGGGSIRCEMDELIVIEPLDTSKVTRVTIVTETGREYEGWNLFKEGAVLHLQDDGRTLKIFPKGAVDGTR